MVVGLGWPKFTQSAVLWQPSTKAIVVASLLPVNATVAQAGFLVNPCVKFRINSLAIGLDIAVLHSGAANYTIVDNAGGTFNATASAGSLYITSITIGKTF